MEQEKRTARIVGALERNAGKVILSAVLVTVLLLGAVIALPPEDEASADPQGEVIELRDRLDDRFDSTLHGAGYIAESRDGDILTQQGLWELLQNQNRLQELDAAGELAPSDVEAQPVLFKGFHSDANRPFVGAYTLANAVDEVLTRDLGTDLANASDEQVKVAIHRIFADPETRGLRDSLSVKAVSETRSVNGETIQYWTSPAIVFGVTAENAKIGGGNDEITLGGDESAERKQTFNREVQRTLRGDQSSYRLWGIAIDQTLEAEEEGQAAGMFVMFAVIVAVLVVGLVLRSYWAMALTGVGLAVLMIWLKGISNLIGIEGGLTIELIVPIAMIALGVDFAIHAIRRYKEEQAAGLIPRRAFQVGLTGVLGALVLAMASDGVAFLTNTVADIESVTHLGIAAAIAVASAFLVLGIVVPLALMRIEETVGRRVPARSRLAKAGGVLSVASVATLSGTSVIFVIAVSPIAGAVVLAGLVAVHIALPLVRHRRRGAVASQTDAPVDLSVTSPNIPHNRLAVALTRLATLGPIVLTLAAVVTAGAVFSAMKLEPTFDAGDFFSGGSDFVVGLDKLDEHVADNGGEGATVYVEGDLDQPEAVAALVGFRDAVQDNRYLAREADGSVIVSGQLSRLLEQMVANDYARAQVTATTGVAVTDGDGDGLPDSSAQIQAVYDYTLQNGLPLDQATLVYTPGEVRSRLFQGHAGQAADVTTIGVEIHGTREQTTIKAARLALEDDLVVFEGVASISRVGLTGSPFVREAQLDATTKALQVSIPIAAVATFLLLLLAMRSLRYALVTIVPVGLVAAWLYGLMYVFGFSLNFVSATIGAISIGVGIDYAIHMTERFREELARSDTKLGALGQAINGSGMALLGSAASSIAGFAIMGFAPMPLFASYGILTAIMIFLALSASVLVLPSLLLLVTPELQPQAEAVGPDRGRSGTLRPRFPPWREARAPI